MHVAYSSCVDTSSGLLIGLTLLAGPRGLTPVCVIMLVSVFLPTLHAILTGHELRTGFFRLYFVPLHFHYPLA